MKRRTERLSCWFVGVWEFWRRAEIEADFVVVFLAGNWGGSFIFNWIINGFKKSVLVFIFFLSFSAVWELGILDILVANCIVLRSEQIVLYCGLISGPSWAQTKIWTRAFKLFINLKNYYIYYLPLLSCIHYSLAKI